MDVGDSSPDFGGLTTPRPVCHTPTCMFNKPLDGDWASPKGGSEKPGAASQAKNEGKRARNRRLGRRKASKSGSTLGRIRSGARHSTTLSWGRHEGSGGGASAAYGGMEEGGHGATQARTTGMEGGPENGMSSNVQKMA